MVEVKLKGVNRISKKLASGEMRYYNYHRATGIRLPDDAQSPGFLKAYSDAQGKIKSSNRNRGTLKELIQRYMRSSAYQGLATRTRKDYQRQIVKIENTFGDMPIAALNDYRVRQDFLNWRDELGKASKKQADYALSVLGLVLAWAVDNSYIKQNYAARPKKLYRSERAAIIWTKDDKKAFLDVAGPHVQLAFFLGLNTGQRQGDLLRLTWSAYDGKYIRLTQSKTGARVEIPVTSELKELLDKTKVERVQRDIDATTILTRPDGRPWRVDHFRHEWRSATLAAGVDGKRFQDLRGTLVTNLADAGCTAFEIASITGHSPKSVEAILEHYLAGSRVRADNAIYKLENAKGTNSANQAANQNSQGSS